MSGTLSVEPVQIRGDANPTLIIHFLNILVVTVAVVCRTAAALLSLL
jgi:hypothetical protein